MIIFKKVRWKNFLATGNNFIEIDLNSKNKTAILGNNGNGKSALLDALTFGLFGKPYRNIPKNGLVNSINKKYMEVQIEFTIDKNEYKIIRGIAPNKFIIIKDGIEFEELSSTKDQQKEFEDNVLKMNFKTFIQVVILGVASFVPFMQLPANQRRELIENLLDINIFSSMNQILKSKILENNQLLNTINSSRNILDEKINSQQRVIDLIKNSKQKSDTEINEKIIITEEKLSAETKELSSVIIEMENLQNLQNKDIGIIKENYSKYNIMLHRLKDKINSLNKEKKFLKDNNICSTCKQELDDKFKNERVREINDNITKVNEGINKTENSIDELKELIRQNDIVENSLSKVKNKKSILDNNIGYIKREISSLKSELNKKDITDNIVYEENKLLELNHEYEKLVEEENSYKHKREIYNLSSELLKDSGIKSSIVSLYLPQINSLINKYLADMDFFIDFHLDENFKEIIKSRFRDEFHYQNFSEGEKLRIDICLLFAWRMIAKIKNSVNTNILIMDEIFDSSLDANGTDEFLKILNDVCKDMNVFIISHKLDALYEHFNSTITFTKNKGFSEIK